MDLHAERLMSSLFDLFLAARFATRAELARNVEGHC